MCHREPGSCQACGAEGPCACRLPSCLWLYWYALPTTSRRPTSHTMTQAANGGPPAALTTLKRHQWVFRASTLGRSAGWQGSQGHMCGAFSSPKTVILRRAPDRLSTISTTGSCTGQTTMSLRGLSARLGASLALDRQSSRVVADVACGW